MIFQHELRCENIFSNDDMNTTSGCVLKTHIHEWCHIIMRDDVSHLAECWKITHHKPSVQKRHSYIRSTKGSQHNNFTRFSSNVVKNHTPTTVAVNFTRFSPTVVKNHTSTVARCREKLHTYSSHWFSQNFTILLKDVWNSLMNETLATYIWMSLLSKLINLVCLLKKTIFEIT